MKITKEELQQIIKEEIEAVLKEEKVKIHGARGLKNGRDVYYVQDQSDKRDAGQRPELSLEDQREHCRSRSRSERVHFSEKTKRCVYDYLDDPNDPRNFQEEQIIKITKEQLQQIIKEELEAALNEDGHEDVPSAIRTMKTVIEDVGQMLETLEGMEGSLPTWWTNKMAVAGSMLNKMRDYLLFDGETPLTEGVNFHLEHSIPITENIFRKGTEKYFDLFREVRELSKNGKYQLNEEEVEIIEETEIGEFGLFEGKVVPLDFPMLIEENFEMLDEKKKKKKKKKNPPLNKPSLNSGGGKKYKVFVRNPKTGGIKKITFGDKKGGLKGNWNNSEARASFAKRHKCAEKKDKTKAGYWACRAHKYFGKNVPGRFW